MAQQEKFIMRVIVSEGDIRKLTMTTRPNTLEDLIGWLKGTLQENYNFVLQYQDPDFNNELCNLEDVSELPDKPTIKIIPMIELVPVTKPVEQPSLCSDASSLADTEILSSSSLDRSVPWPEVFEIPKFSVDVEYRLRQGNLLYLRDGTYLKVTKELKHDILEKLAEVIYAFDAYPKKEDLAAVAQALVETHPCLKEAGSPSGCVGWKNSLKFKVGNYRAKMCKLGRLDVTVNSGKRGRYSTNGDPPNKDIKKPRKGEINFLPQYPEGLDDRNLEAARQVLVNEMMKAKPNGSLIKKEMDMTFALRRKEVVTDKPAITQIVQRWPALFSESQVCMPVLSIYKYSIQWLTLCDPNRVVLRVINVFHLTMGLYMLGYVLCFQVCYEFTRVVGKNLKENFFEALDRFSPNLMDFFRKKRGLSGQLLTDLLRQTKVG
uniref:PB1 domain-containing protein n=1 Tax=Seriola dumerili TaxID=41447 RepID=A0A3B4U491_SERDU